MISIIAFLLLISIIFFVLIYCLIVIKRHFIDKKPFKGGTEVTALGTYSGFATKEKQVGIEHIQYLKEKILEDDDGEKK